MRYCTLMVLVVITSCIDPFYKETPGNQRIMTVDGIITTADGPHEISLTYANQYSNTSDGNRISVTNASVYLEDDEGNQITLEEGLIGVNTRFFNGVRFVNEVVFSPNGRYKTPADFRAEIGRSYTLYIRTEDDSHYQSLPETVVAGTQLESVEVGFFNTPTLNPLNDTRGVALTAHFNDPAEEQNYYFWNLSDSFFALVTEPELYHLPPTDPFCPRCPAPKDCCALCFTNDMLGTVGNFSVSRDIGFNGLTTQLVVARLPDNGIRFKSRYRVKVNQYAISERSYRFLQLVRQQLDIQGSVFDPPPANIRGNIVSIDQPEQQVLGYFFAADVSSKTVYFNRGDIPAEYRATPAIIPDDCRLYESFLDEEPTLAPPDDWEWN